ncbi:hypothetical protein ABZY10_37710, partial [Streptomyces sp. NPDC006539]|uniref:hypothetical protein n=1 Tax=Streptomyces sp. NPDC006539 TaxID=3155352 RepID=UPI0033A50624
PADSTQTLGTLTYQNSFVSLDYGAGAVVGPGRHPGIVPGRRRHRWFGYTGRFTASAPRVADSQAR